MSSASQLLLGPDFIRPLAAGIFSYLPLSQTAQWPKWNEIVRKEIDGIGGQESYASCASGRCLAGIRSLVQNRFQMATSKIAPDHDMVLAMTHEEIVSDLVRKEIRSYRQLPVLRLPNPDQMA